MADNEQILTITVDRSKCCGYTLCAAEAADVYSIDDEGYAVAPASVPAELEDQARRGAAACPDSAIILRRKNATGEGTDGA
ncbi:ferredoxin [Mycobacterium europaeum]|uniref:Ferredoxin n=1 Tax=Mycobacterium europaeum TaxID=761804 RepID=A0A0U1DL99_9MYCO|nr:ferredoxin [Mycobacterium europaeum]CQD18682.1 ferredoxin [Mycobacterium europaeum]